MGGVLLLIAAILEPSKPGNILAFFGSTLMTGILMYAIVASRFSHSQGIDDAPSGFERLRPILIPPVLVSHLTSSLISLLVSAVLLLRLRTNSSPSLCPKMRNTNPGVTDVDSIGVLRCPECDARIEHEIGRAS